MATQSRVTPTGWLQYDDSATFSRITPNGWEQFNAVPVANMRSFGVIIG